MKSAIDVREIVSTIAAVDLTEMSEEQLATCVLDAEQLLNAAHCLSALALAEWQRRGGWAEDGALSAAGWAAVRTGSPAGALRARVRAGAGLRLLPSALPAARSGRLGAQHVDALARCARRHPDLAVRDEALLVDQALALDADTFSAVARAWEEHATAVDGPDPVEAPPPEPVDELHVSRTFDGRYQLNGTFSADSGQLVAAALEGQVDRQLRAARDGDPSVAPVASQLRAAALVDLVAQTMRREPSDASTPDRYRVAVVVRHNETDDLPVAACDSAAFRVVLGAGSEVLDVGRLTQQWPAGIRRAITIRDGGCMFPGCDRPPSWCDIHHAEPWNEGGKTSVENGALLCRRHHTFIHKSRWAVTIDDGKPIVRKPDGTPPVIKRLTTESRGDLLPA